MRVTIRDCLTELGFDWVFLYLKAWSTWVMKQIKKRKKSSVYNALRLASRSVLYHPEFLARVQPLLNTQSHAISGLRLFIIKSQILFMSRPESIRPLSRNRNIFLSRSPEQSKPYRFQSEQSLKITEQAPSDEDENETQLFREIETTRANIRSYQRCLNRNDIPQVLSPNEACLYHLQNLEHIICNKDQQIRNINEEIKVLRSAPEELSRATPKKYKNLREANLFKLAGEVAQLRNQLLPLQKLHEDKLKQCQKRKVKMHSVQMKYFQVCSVMGKTVLSYQQFRAAKLDRKRIQENSRVKKHMIRQAVIGRDYEDMERSSRSPPSIGLQQAINKLEIAEAALKNLRKKHQIQRTQLKSKVQFLRDEEQQLKHKLQTKQEELAAVGARFNQQKTPAGRKKKRMKRLSEPDL